MSPITIWTQDPEAQLLLAECAVNPPAKQTFHYRFQETEERYVGPEARRLRAIRDSYLGEALRLRDRTGRDAGFIRNAALSVTQAIDNARAAIGYSETVEEGFTVSDQPTLQESTVEQFIRLQNAKQRIAA